MHTILHPSETRTVKHRYIPGLETTLTVRTEDHGRTWRFAQEPGAKNPVPLSTLDRYHVAHDVQAQAELILAEHAKFEFANGYHDYQTGPSVEARKALMEIADRVKFPGFEIRTAEMHGYGFEVLTPYGEFELFSNRAIAEQWIKGQMGAAA